MTRTLFMSLPAVLALVAGCVKPGPPTVPELAGPEAGQPGETLCFKAVSRDRNRDNLSYLFDWGDGSTPVWSPEAAAGETMRARHAFAGTGVFAVRVRSRDETGREGGWSPGYAVSVGFAGPVTPPQPSGPVAAWPEAVLVYSVAAGHVRQESVSVQFDWGDSLGGWSGMAAAGSTLFDSHAFRASGDYAVRCRARDRAGNTSPWSAELAVAIGRRPVEPPRSARLMASSGIYVKLRWDPGRNDDSVTYFVWFRDVAMAEFVAVDSVYRTNFIHDPMGRTGDYTLSARRAGEERFAADTLSTVPVSTDTVVLYELNAPGLCGYGWDSVTNVGGPRTMLDTARARLVSCYFTDFAQGRSGPYYYISSPHLGPNDPGGLIRPGPWPTTGLYALWGSIQEPLPEYDSTLYQDVVDVSSLRTDMSVYGGTGHYALLSTFGPDSSTGTARVLSWFQTVPGLRLIAHRE